MGLLEDARNIQRKDPAARSVLEVMLLYPGFHILPGHSLYPGSDRHIPVSGRSGRDFREVGNDELQATKKGGGCLWQPPSFVQSVRVHDAPGRFQLTGNGTGWRPRYLIRSPAASLALISFTASL